MTATPIATPHAAGCSLIVPLDVSRRPLGILRRLRRYLNAPLPAGATEVVLAHMDYGARWDEMVRRCVDEARARGRPIVYARTERRAHEHGIPLGRLRNVGVAASSGADLLFADIDFVLPADVIGEARRLRGAQQVRFVSVPVIYLSCDAELPLFRVGSSDHRSSELLQALVATGALACVDSFAINGSLILVARAHFDALGGFHEDYCGHGYEDFDLLMRLAAAEEQAPLPRSVLRNQTTVDPTQAVGFRSYLSRYTTPILAEGLIAYHLHHWRPRGDGYFEARNDNYRLFCERMQQLGIVAAPGAAPAAAEFDAGHTRGLFEAALRGAVPEVCALPFSTLQRQRIGLQHWLKRWCTVVGERVATRLA